MPSIINNDSDPIHLQTLRRWFTEEWGHIDPFKTAIVAVDGEEPVAGLVFSRYPKPGCKESGLWINAVFVMREYRKQGIGSMLIEAAEAEASCKNVDQLYAYTNVPGLYLKKGWLIVSDEGDHKVLKKLTGIVPTPEKQL